MALTPGTRLGRYEIRSPLGAGGMGEVYLARDASLQRDVAVKVLPPEFAADPSRLRRFQQEALATAAFNHPHIVAIFDVGTHDGIAYVVTELLDGRTLRDTLAAGALTVRKAVQYASQIAAGLAEAHDKGIVHRDLKPENVFLTADDRIKILDFGIARVLDESPLAGGQTGTPTATMPGSVIGTVGYMAPEQVRGERVDHRADIFAFGAVLYEMLTRRRAFKCETVPQTLSAILSDDLPAWTGETSPLFNRAMRIAQRCVEKSPGARFQSARDLSLVLADESTDASSAQIPEPARGFAGRRAGLALGAVVAIAFAAFGYWIGTRSSAAAPVAAAANGLLTTFPITLPEGVTASTVALALSPDGRFLANVLRKDQTGHLFVLDLQSGVWDQLKETEGASNPIFSPDGNQIAFLQGERLMRASLKGGPPNQICEKHGNVRGGVWLEDDVLVVGTSGGGLRRVAVDDCTTQTITTPEEKADHRSPVVVPGTQVVLFTIQRANFSTDIGAMRMGTSSATVLVKDARSPQFVNGHVVFTTSRGDVFAAPFDQSAITLGARVPLSQRPAGGENTSMQGIKVAAQGTMAYVPRRDRMQRLAIVERTGAVRTLGAPPDGYSSVRFDPIHERFVVAVNDDFGNTDVAVCRIDCNSLTKITDNQNSRFPIWTPDGKSIIYSQRVENGEWLRTVDIDSTDRPIGEVRALVPTTQLLPISAIGRRLVAHFNAGSASEFWFISLDDPSDRTPPLALGRMQYGARVSATGLMAFVSQEHSVRRVAVVRYPIRTPPTVLDPGTGVVWSAKGDELFFQRQDQIWSQRFANGAPVGKSEPTAVRGTNQNITAGPGVPSYDVLPDGRFIIILGSRDDRGPQVPVVVRNWTSSFDQRK